MMNLLTLAQDSDGGGGAIFVLVELAILVFFIVTFWKIFGKAGQPGWYSLIPIFNIYILLKIVGRPWWWLILFLIPIVGFIIAIVVTVDLAKSFGKGVGFAIGMILLGIVFYPILAFGKAEYQGPAAA